MYKTNEFKAYAYSSPENEDDNYYILYRNDILKLINGNYSEDDLYKDNVDNTYIHERYIKNNNYYIFKEDELDELKKNLPNKDDIRCFEDIDKNLLNKHDYKYSLDYEICNFVDIKFNNNIETFIQEEYEGEYVSVDENHISNKYDEEFKTNPFFVAISEGTDGISVVKDGEDWYAKTERIDANGNTIIDLYPSSVVEKMVEKYSVLQKENIIEEQISNKTNKEINVMDLKDLNLDLDDYGLDI